LKKYFNETSCYFEDEIGIMIVQILDKKAKEGKGLIDFEMTLLLLALKDKMVLKKDYIARLMLVQAIVLVLICGHTRVFAEQISNDGEKIILESINGFDVITEYSNLNEIVKFEYDENGNRIRKEVSGKEYFYSYIDDILTEEIFEGHIVRYISENNNGDVTYIGCELMA